MIQELEAKRDAARASAHGHASHLELEELRSSRVFVKTKLIALCAKRDKLLKDGVSAAAVSGQIADLERELALLDEKTAPVHGEVYAELTDAQAALHDARLAERTAAHAELAKNYAGLTVEQLEAERHSLSAERRVLKAKQRAVVVALEAAKASEELDKLVESMSPEQRAALLAKLG